MEQAQRFQVGHATHTVDPKNRRGETIKRSTGKARIGVKKKSVTAG